MDEACKSNGFRPMADEVEHVGTCREVGDNLEKSRIILDSPFGVKIYRFLNGLRAISLLVR